MGIALSTSVQQQLSNFVEANMTDGNIKSQDKTGLYDVEGKVFSPKVLSLGYSSVSLGETILQIIALRGLPQKF